MIESEAETEIDYGAESADKLMGVIVALTVLAALVMFGIASLAGMVV